MQKLKFIKENYPQLFEELLLKLPSGFFKNPDKAPTSEQRKYNDIVSAYFMVEHCDFKIFNILQILVAA